MDVEEVRKRKGEVEAAICSIVQKFMDSTNTDVIKIELMRQFGAAYNCVKVTKVIMKVELYSR